MSGVRTKIDENGKYASSEYASEGSLATRILANSC